MMNNMPQIIIMLFRINTYSFLFLCLVFSIILMSSPVAAQIELPSVQTEIRALASKNSISVLPIEDGKGFYKFYEERNFTPLWDDKEEVEDIIELLQNSWTHGLNPRNYLSDLLLKLKDSPHEADKAPLDVMFSAAVVRYGRDLTGMRVSPDELGQTSASWQKPASAYALLNYVAAENDKSEALEALPPQSKLYSLLRQELVRQIENLDKPDPFEHVLPIKINGTLRPGDMHGVVHNIRYRLGMQAEPYNDTYDDSLVKALMQFQHANGLRPDGLIGQQTLNAMNKTRQDQIEQIIANLERMRWLDPRKPEKYLIVNIPAQTLWAVEGGRIIHEMPVVVGRRGRETLSFKARVTGVRFNPTWTVPKTIKFEDYVPKLKEDPYYLDDKNVTFIEGWGEEAQILSSSEIDWANLSDHEIKRIRIVQSAGTNNPLGRIRLLMPNKYDIFLHDTNTDQYFGRSARALSSGCVRMSRPERVANFVLSDNANWDENSLTEILESGKMRDIPASTKIPVYLIYQSAWLDDRGRLVLSPDLYDWDRDLAQKLRAKNEIFIPQSV